ncbi:hypothetical protein BDZ90DRAFT_258848 [Jaminaea rosea]|uniref:WIBG Mago-binding domain-containing protein n=1 Tax=Jaminaea rosea TaxID=1569628 RepID=A0A316UTZ3_9BASI|nr:hypothetical protein BDZ90DRAFT_258848 [Jaminaea rosea]PWN28767.1 hypothetical protein BDZ90DRAFT_258848 [Jaminaea rosea]
MSAGPSSPAPKSSFTASGIVSDPSGGPGRVIPESRRADGSIRKERRVKPGFTPNEDVARFRPSRLQKRDEEEERKGTAGRVVPGVAAAGINGRRIEGSPSVSPLIPPPTSSSTASPQRNGTDWPSLGSSVSAESAASSSSAAIQPPSSRLASRALAQALGGERPKRSNGFNASSTTANARHTSSIPSSQDPITVRPTDLSQERHQQQRRGAADSSDNSRRRAPPTTAPASSSSPRAAHSTMAAVNGDPKRFDVPLKDDDKAERLRPSAGSSMEPESGRKGGGKDVDDLVKGLGTLEVKSSDADGSREAP